MAPATTIFQLLTCPNPTVDQVGYEPKAKSKSKSRTNTTNQDYMKPTRVEEWAEMQDLQAFREVFGGKLFEEAHREGRELDRPPIWLEDCVVVTERQAGKLFNRWNQVSVMKALDPIRETYRPLIWAEGKNLTGITVSPPQPHRPKTRVQPVRASAQKGKGNQRLISLDQLDPDSVSIPSYPDSPGERGKVKFIMEYKVAAKWKSSWIKEKEVIEEDGTWRGVRNPTSWPIMQAFTYCVKYMCRYACILTCEEAFLFRVRPLDEGSSSEDPDLLRERLRKNGLLEYVSIPWGNHCQSDPKAYNEWTINLILWFIHVAGGKNSGVQWSYLPLKEETTLPSEHLRLQEQALSPIAEVSSDNSSPLSSARSISPPEEVSSGNPETDSQNTSQSSNDKVASDGTTPSDPEQSLSGEPHSDGRAPSSSEQPLDDKPQSDSRVPSDSEQPLDEELRNDDTASPSIGASKRKRRREGANDQMSTEADNNDITARREPKRNKYNLRARPSTSPTAK